MPCTVASPSPVPSPGRLGREERLERAVGDLGIHAGALVGDRDLDALAGAARRAIVSAPPCGHRVARVDREVHEHLLEPRAVGEHRRQRVGAVDLQLDALAERARQQRLEVGDELADVEHLGRARPRGG